jgi:hypothetical protein
MKNIILQHFDGELRELDYLSIQNIKRYAKMVGAEYELITGKPFDKNLTAPCQKVYMIEEEFDGYDNVLMLDIDMFAPKGMTENIFDLPGVGLYHTVQQRLHKQLVQLYPMLANIDSPYWGGAIYKMNRDLRQKLRGGLNTNRSWMLKFNKPYHFEDEGIIHVLANRAGIQAQDTYLDPKWCQCSFLPNPEKAGFIHIRTKITPQGPKREKIENYNELVRAGIII